MDCGRFGKSGSTKEEDWLSVTALLDSSVAVSLAMQVTCWCYDSIYSQRINGLLRIRANFPAIGNDSGLPDGLIRVDIRVGGILLRLGD